MPARCSVVLRVVGGSANSGVGVMAISMPYSSNVVVGSAPSNLVCRP